MAIEHVPEPRRHHYVPESYLRGFTLLGRSGSIVVFDKERGVAYRTSVKNVAVRRDYYRIEGATVDDPIVIERALSKLEDKALPLVEQLTAGKELEGKDREVWAEFMAVTLLRVPSFRQFYAEATAQMMLFTAEVALSSRATYERVVNEMQAAGRDVSRLTREGVLEFLRGGNYNIGVNEEFTLRSFELINTLVPIFADMNWRVYEAGPRAHFITTDTPLTFGSPRSSHDPLRGDGGLLNDQVEVIFPLTKKFLMVASWKEMPTPRQISPQGVEHINWRLARDAHHYAYGPVEDDTLLSVAKATKGGGRRIRWNDAPKVNLKRPPAKKDR